MRPRAFALIGLTLPAGAAALVLAVEPRLDIRVRQGPGAGPDAAAPG